MPWLPACAFPSKKFKVQDSITATYKVISRHNTCSDLEQHTPVLSRIGSPRFTSPASKDNIGMGIVLFLYFLPARRHLPVHRGDPPSSFDSTCVASRLYIFTADMSRPSPYCRSTPCGPITGSVCVYTIVASPVHLAQPTKIGYQKEIRSDKGEDRKSSPLLLTILTQNNTSLTLDSYPDIHKCSSR